MRNSLLDPPLTVLGLDPLWWLVICSVSLSRGDIVETWAWCLYLLAGFIEQIHGVDFGCIAQSRRRKQANGEGFWFPVVFTNVVFPQIFVLESVESIPRHMDAVANIGFLAVGIGIRQPEGPMRGEETRRVD